ncbi:MAG: hypothetical protein AB3N20_12920 [Rhizobiaceae bacterium]
MPAAKRHFRYADALISASVKEFSKKGPRASKRAVIKATKAPGRASYTASYNEDKRRRPKNPASNWSATAAAINRNIENRVWKTTKSAYNKVRREKSELYQPVIGNGTSFAALLGLATTHHRLPTQISRRALLVGGSATLTSALVLASTDARAENWGYIGEVKSDINAYVASKRPSIEASLRAGLQ